MIRWRLHLRSPVADVHRALTTAEGRASFWAESAPEQDGFVEFRILGYPPYRGRVLALETDTFAVEYFGTRTTFHLSSADDGGTDLSLTCEVDDEDVRAEMSAGWVSVLLAMKAAVDFGVDLRNHHPERIWDLGFVDN